MREEPLGDAGTSIFLYRALIRTDAQAAAPTLIEKRRGAA
jgi:hypothetical protein